MSRGNFRDNIVRHKVSEDHVVVIQNILTIRI